MGPFSLEKEGSGRSYQFLEILMRGSRHGATLFSVLLSDRTRCNGHKKDRKPQINAREKPFLL